MTRAMLAWLLLAAPGVASAADEAARDHGTVSRPFNPFARKQGFGGPALHRDSLLNEVDAGERKLFAHDPKVKSARDPKNQFLIVRDKYVSSGGEHALGILTPAGEEQPSHIRNVKRTDAAHLGRMIRTLMFSDSKSENAPEGGFEEWQLYVNLSPAVPRLHIHAQPGRQAEEKVSDWNAFAKDKGYTLKKGTASYNVWQWTGEGRAPHGWSVLAVGDAKLGSQAQLASLAEGDAGKVDKVIGDVWLEAAKYAKGHQVETSRTDAQIVARGVGW